MTSLRRLLVALSVAVALTPMTAAADWTTYHLDQARTGNDTTEPAATTVASVWNTTLVGQVYAEPLLVGETLLVATERNNVYGLDAGSGAVLWSNTSLGAPVPQSSLPCGNINPVGITGTPVVDTARGLMYVVATLAQPSIHYELYAINISNGATVWHQTIAPAGFNTIYQGQRSALALANGRVYIPFGGRAGDCGTYMGWVVGASASGPGPLSTFSLPYGHEGGIWAPSGAAVDGAGYVYATTGNTTCGSSCNPFDYGETVLKLSPTLGLVDWWAPTNWAPLNAGDVDLGSVGPALLPNNLLFQAGKAGDGYLVRTTPSMGHISAPAAMAHVCPGLTSNAAFGGTAWATPYLYVACRTKLVALSVNTSTPSLTVAWQGPAVSYAGPPILAGGVVWTIDPAGTLYGLDPTTGSTRYSLPITFANHFATPTAGLGRLFVPAGQVIRAYTLTPSPWLSRSPRSLTFANRAVGTTSPAQASTLTNSGTAPLTISSIAASGDFAQTNTCGTLPATFAPGTGCSVSVTFTPTAQGIRTGALTITNDAAGSPHQVGLTGYSYPFAGAYTLDGFGGLHPDGGSPAMAGGAYWPNWKIARSGGLFPSGSGGYVLDGYGGLHEFGNAPLVSAAYFGWDIARDVVLLPSSSSTNPRGYTLDGFGGIHPFGSAPAVNGGTYWPNWDIAKRLVVLSDETGGYVMDGWGGLHPFAIGTNQPPPVITNNAYWHNWSIVRDIALAPGATRTSVAGVTLDGYGGIHPFGSSGVVAGATAYWGTWDIARAVRYAADSTPSSPKGWVMDGWGGSHAFGGAPDLAMGGYWPNWDIAVQLILR